MIKIPNYKDISAATNQVATKSAMNPMLWKSAIAFPVGVVCSIFAHDPLNYIIIGISSLPVVTGCLVYPFFARFDPNRLQSETHLENMEMLSRFSSRDGGKVITIEADPVVTNRPSLEDNR